MGIVFSHRTAALVYRAAGCPVQAGRLPAAPAPLARCYPSKAAVAAARRTLALLGIPPAETGLLDVLVAGDSVRSSDPALTCHVFSAALPAHSIRTLADGVFVVSPELCFLQMACVFIDRRELVEYGYELCGGYALPIDPQGAYRERSPLATVASLEALLKSFKRVAGLRRAAWALRYVREGSRSPMETANVMTIVLPKRLGGAGVASVRMNLPVPVPEEHRDLTRRRWHVCDAAVPKKLLDLEYNGFHHDDEFRKAEDEERRAALEAMGYRVKVLTKQAFFNRDAYRRYLRSVFRILGIAEESLPPGFWTLQEELRRFVLRRWLGG